MRPTRALICIAACALYSFGHSVQFVAAQSVPATYAPDTFVDPGARTLFEAAQTNWRTVDEFVVRYTALIKQRISVAIRTPLKDRILYRNETAVRAFWDQDYDAVVQVLGTHSQYPGRSIAVREGDMDWLDDLPFDEPFDPGGDRLFFGAPGGDDDDDEGIGFWIAHPLAPGADTVYRYESGDTLTLSLPDGRRLQSVQLDVLPRVADSHRITGTLWIEPQSGALVRAVYRLSRQFDAIRDIEELSTLMPASEARVTIDRSSGTVVVSGNARISPVIVSHKGMTVLVRIPEVDPAEPRVESQDFVSLGTNRADSSTVSDLLQALNQLKVPINDRIAILTDIQQAGKLHAKLIFKD